MSHPINPYQFGKSSYPRAITTAAAAGEEMGEFW
jgi:hypothetical protein